MNLLDTLNNPSMMHAAIVHFPVVLFVLAIPVAALALAYQRRYWPRVLMLVLFAGLLASCLVAEQTGELAQAKVPAGMDQVVWDQINEHASLAETLKFIAAAGVVLSLLSLIPHPFFTLGGALLALCAAFGGSVVTAVTAHYGGELVYRHGIGTTLLEKQMAAPAAAPASAPTEAPKAPDADLVPILDIDPVAAAAISFSNDVWPIFEARCLDCHDGPEGDGGYDMSSLAAMMKPGEKGATPIIPGDADGSSIVQYIRGVLTPRMPKKKKPMPEEELHVIRMWIAAGAKDDSAAAAPMVIDIAPAPVMEVEEEPAPAPEPTPAPAPEPMPEPEPAPAPEPMPEPVVVEIPVEAPAVVETPAPVEVMEVAPVSAPAVVEEVVKQEVAPVVEEMQAAPPAEAPAPAEVVAPVEAPPAPVEEAPIQMEVAPVAVETPAPVAETFDPFTAPAPTVEEEFEPEPAAAGE